VQDDLYYALEWSLKIAKDEDKCAILTYIKTDKYLRKHNYRVWKRLCEEFK